jgi:hypothetical protein
MSKGRVALITGAVLFAAAGIVARYVVLPGATLVPKDYSSTSHYEGVISTLNPAGLAAVATGGDPAAAFIKNVPVTATQIVKAKSTSGSTVVMTDDTEVKTPDGTVVAKSDHLFAVDRKTLVATAVPAGSGAEEAKGLPLGFAFAPEKKNYDYWDSSTLKAAPAVYSGTDKREGRTVYVYKVTNTGPVADAGTLAQLPKQLPKALLVALIPAEMQAGLAPMLAVLPDMLDLSYDSTTTTNLYVDSVTGSILDSDQHQVIMANIVVGGQAQPFQSVLDLTLKSTAPDVVAGAKDAADNEKALNVIGLYGPIGAGVIALLLLVLAFTVAGRRKPAVATAGAPMTETPAETPVVPAPAAPAETETMVIEEDATETVPAAEDATIVDPEPKSE